ncbi:MAG: T9SS type A sorting domain-containing protein, partial [Bacteroidia bacterium]|nr:T9SS type A sorting domain-containing protein [Bacteroidia bacterium]
SDLTIIFFVCISFLSFANRIDSLNIIHYNLDLSFKNLPSKTIQGKAQLSAVSNFQNLSKVSLDLLGLKIDSIMVESSKVYFSQGDSTFTIQLPKEYYQTDTFSIEIFYQGSPVKDPKWGGFYYSGNYAFNMGVGMGSNPPNFGRCWFPCNDNFTDRATYEFHITTDSGFMAVCSGIQEPATVNTDGSITWNWRLAQTIPTYLANVAVSKYVLINSSHMGLYREIPIVLAVAAADTAKARASFFRLNQAIKCFEERFGPYLFDRVGYVGVPFNAGAMEHACNISYPLYAVDGTGNYETLMAHELAHSWFGNLVTTRTASDMWLNEGWASYCEALFLECAYGKNSYNEKIAAELFEYLRWAHARDGGFLPVSGVPLDQTYGTHVYTKGGMMVHTLRNMMGDSAFFTACKNYLSTLKFRDVNSFNLMDYFTGYSQVNLIDFFNTWIYDPGDIDVQITDWKKIINEADKFQLHTQQQRRYKTNLLKSAKLNLNLYYTNGSQLSVPVDITPDWSGKAISNFTLSENQSKNIAFAVLNEDNKLSLGKTFQKEWVKTTGIKNFTNALLTYTVKDISDSALVYIEHHFAAPSLPNGYESVPKGIRVSQERFWRIHGIWNSENFNATAFFNYDGSMPISKNGGFLDNDLIKTSEDSLVLLYRPNSGAPFTIETDLTFQPGASKTDKIGRFWVNNLKQGDYVFGYKDFTATTKQIHAPLRQILIYPNPNEGTLFIELPENHLDGTILISNSEGKLSPIIKVKKSDAKMEINTENYPSGVYFIIYEDSFGKLSRSFIVK